jgi:1-acyl-sn-glycerol-3-phosphate acyltransferase
MLKAKKSPLFERIFSIYNRNLLNRRFHSLQIFGLENLANSYLRWPLIIYCNHSSWWDGLVAFQISRECSLNSYVMMEEKQLKELFLFRKLGAFSVVRDNPREALQSIKYAIKILRDEKAVLWIFPQGRIAANDQRPLKFYNGISKIILNLDECAAISLSMRYEFLGNFKPQIFVKIDEPDFFSDLKDYTAKQLTARFAENLTKNLDGLKKDIIEDDLSKYKSII